MVDEKILERENKIKRGFQNVTGVITPTNDAEVEMAMEELDNIDLNRIRQAKLNFVRRLSDDKKMDIIHYKRVMEELGFYD